LRSPGTTLFAAGPVVQRLRNLCAADHAATAAKPRTGVADSARDSAAGPARAVAGKCPAALQGNPRSHSHPENGSPRTGPAAFLDRCAGVAGAQAFAAGVVQPRWRRGHGKGSISA